MAYDASNRKDIRRAEKASAQFERDRVNFLISAMGIAQGRAYFFNLLEACNCFADPFTGQPYLEAYKKGERNVGMKIYLDIMQNCPDHYVQMWKEANERRIIRDTDNDRSDDPAAAGEQPGSEDDGRDAEGPVRLSDNFVDYDNPDGVNR